MNRAAWDKHCLFCVFIAENSRWLHFLQMSSSTWNVLWPLLALLGIETQTENGGREFNVLPIPTTLVVRRTVISEPWLLPPAGRKVDGCYVLQRNTGPHRIMWIQFDNVSLLRAPVSERIKLNRYYGGLSASTIVLVCRKRRKSIPVRVVKLM